MVGDLEAYMVGDLEAITKQNSAPAVAPGGSVQEGKEPHFLGGGRVPDS